MILMGSVERMLKEGKHPAQGLIDFAKEKQRREEAERNAHKDHHNGVEHRFKGAPDFADVPIDFSNEVVDPSLMVDDLETEPLQPRVDAELADRVVKTAGGILGDLTDWMVSTARFPQPLLSLGASIALVGALMGHRYKLLEGPDTRSNIMILALAASGSGKDHPRRCVLSALHEAGLGQYTLGRSIASAQGIHGALLPAISRASS